MLKLSLSILCFSILINAIVHAQPSDKKILDHSVYDNWKELARPLISDNGEWVSYEINPQKGDGYLHLDNLRTQRRDSISRGQEAQFSNASDLVAFKIKQPENVLHRLKLAKTKKEDLPKDSLGIYLLKTDSLVRIPGLKSFQLPKEGGPWMAYLLEKSKEKKKDEVSDSLKSALPKDSTSVKTQESSNKSKGKKPKKGSFSDTETWQLTIANPVTGTKFIYDNVT
jgi:hypothetical protein